MVPVHQMEDGRIFEWSENIMSYIDSRCAKSGPPPTLGWIWSSRKTRAVTDIFQGGVFIRINSGAGGINSIKPKFIGICPYFLKYRFQRLGSSRCWWGCLVDNGEACWIGTGIWGTCVWEFGKKSWYLAGNCWVHPEVVGGGTKAGVRGMEYWIISGSISISIKSWIKSHQY